MTVSITRWRPALVGSVTLIALAALAGTVAAQVTSEQQSAIRSNCRSDFMSKCSGVTPGGKDALACLQKNVASLAPACKTAVSATMPAPAPAKPAEVKPAPAAPAPAPAAAAAPAAPAATPAAAPVAAPPAPAAARPAIIAAPPPPAVKPQRSQKPVTEPKQAVVTPPAAVAPPAATAPATEAAPLPSEQQMKAIRFTCRREFANNCRGVPPGGAEAIACLQRNPGKLTPDCKTSLGALGDAMPPAMGPQPPVVTRTPNAPVAMTAVIGRACMRDLLLHCRNTGIGDGQKIACLMERGPALALGCQVALKITAPVR
jgi:outer membrane biosynthesis protein TonB